MALDAKLSTLVENQFPAFYKEEGPKFLAFIKAYYQYLETTGKQQDIQRNLKNYKDIDTTLDEAFCMNVIHFFAQVTLGSCRSSSNTNAI